MQKQYDYEAHHSGGLWIKFDRLEFFNVCLNLGKRVFFVFHPRNAATVAGIQSCNPQLSNPAPKLLGYHGGSDKRPFGVSEDISDWYPQLPNSFREKPEISMSLGD